MNKNDYLKPTMKVVKLQHQGHILSASPYETSGQGKTSITEMEDAEDL